MGAAVDEAQAAYHAAQAAHDEAITTWSLDSSYNNVRVILQTDYVLAAARLRFYRMIGIKE